MSVRRIALIGSGLGLTALLGLEIGLRVTLGLGTPPLLQADSTIGYLFQADQHLERFGHRVQINGVHQRSEPLSTRPDSSLLRVLFLGDSVTWGGVLVDQHETYPEVFEAAMDAACAGPVEALNASAGSWGIGNLKAYLDRFGSFDSDVVVVQMGSHDLLQEPSDASPVGTHPAFPTENPRLATQELVTRYLWPRYVRPLVTDPEPQPAAPDSSAQAARFARNMEALGAMIQAVRAADARPLILHTPDRNEVVAGPDGAFATTYAPTDLVFWSWPIRWRCRCSTCPRAGGGGQASGYFRDGVHLSADGNRAVGRVTWEKTANLVTATTCAQ